MPTVWLVAAVYAAFGWTFFCGYEAGYDAASAEAEQGYRAEYCWVGGPEAGYWRCDPRSVESLRAAGYPIGGDDDGGGPGY